MSVLPLCAIPPDSKFVSSVRGAQRALPGGLLPQPFYPPSGPPYRPACWLTDRRTPAVPRERPPATRSRQFGDDTSTMQFASQKVYAALVATSGIDRAMRGPAAGKIRT